MAAKRFHVEKPDQLQSMVQFAKANPCSMARMARIWKNAKQRKGETRWDTSVFAAFSGDRAREAVLYRVDAGGERIEVEKLKYNSALQWCEKNLRQVRE